MSTKRNRFLILFITTVLYTPVLRYTMIHSDKETRNLRHVIIKWTTPDRTKKDMEYKLSIKDDSRTTNWTTEVPHLNLNLTVGVLYTATVFSQRCNGGLRSNFSVPLDIFLEGTIRILSLTFAYNLYIFSMQKFGYQKVQVRFFCSLPIHKAAVPNTRSLVTMYVDQSTYHSYYSVQA